MSDPILIAGTIFLSVALVHFAYVDFRFRHRDSIAWFWLGGPAPTLLWVSRAAVAAALLLALATLVLGATKLVAYILVGLMLVHIGTLIILEIRETR